MPKLDSLSDLLLHLLLDALRFIRLSLRPHCALAAENLFLRKQLALFLERKVKARRASDARRLTLISRFITGRLLLSTPMERRGCHWTALALCVAMSRVLVLEPEAE